ncbi:MAG: hypothetical protein HKN41_05005 [Ilumatobacter sp.]|nr:hypothetical protein [Ilumatobacter sp.]
MVGSTTTTTTRARRTLAVVIGCVGLLATACGGGGPDIEVDASRLSTAGATAPAVEPPSSATTGSSSDPAPATPVTAAPTTAPSEEPESPPTDGGWVNATANLANMESDCGNLTTLASEPGSDTVIAGVALRGLWALDEPGGMWRPLGTAPDSDVLTNRVAAIRFDPDREGAFWASGTYSGNGVFRTSDGGQTLEALGDLLHVDVVSIDMTDPERQTLLASVHEQRDLRLSLDGGATWRSLARNLPDELGRSNSPHVLDSSTFLVGTWLTENPGIYRSVDQGETWTQVFDGYVLELGVPYTLDDGSILWVLHRGGGVIRSTDGGQTWEPWSFTPLVVGIEDMGDGRLASATADQVMISEDDGQTWTWVGPAIPFAPASFAYVAGQRTFYVSQWDCELRVRPDAVAALSLLPD